jgi:NADH-quinone oxidoreductase subunit L
VVTVLIKDLTYLLLFAPLAGVLFNLASYRRLPRIVTGLIATGMVVVSAFVSWILFLNLPSQPFEWVLYGWIETTTLSVSIGFYVDRLTALMLITVTTVSACVHLYSLEYMEDDDGYHRFFIYLNLFVFAMLVLVLANNLLMMFIGWEGVGLCSYLLIGFWYNRESARKAGRKAFIVNRLGDFCFLVGLFILVTYFGTLSFTGLQSSVEGSPWSVIGLAGLCLFGGAVGKSAQFPLYVWLPDAMEGPTPVSSLIHAATMVTAGVYMVARLHFLYALIPGVGEVIAVTGALTAVFAALMALVHPDMKRILAYSTISQLGYMFVAVGVGSYAAGVFHLMTHAFFKGLLFLMAGSVMHGLSGELNIFKMGGLSKSMPVTATMAVVGGLGLAGVPPIAGFWSKDEILLGALGHGGALGWGLFVALVLGALLTAFYTFRMVIVAFWGGGSTDGHECRVPMAAAMALLGIGTVLGGLFTTWTAPLSAHHRGHGSAHTIVMTGSVVASLGGLLLAYLMYQLKVVSPAVIASRFAGVYDLLRDQFRVDEVYRRAVVTPVTNISRFCWRVVDDLLIDGLIRLGGLTVEVCGLLVRFLQTGYIRHYLVYLSGGVAVILTILVIVL